MNSFSVLDYGAIPGSQELQTGAIQRAIDAAFLQGGGEVVVPTGEYFIGGLRLRSNVCLHLLKQAVLIGTRDVDQYFILKSDSLEPVKEEWLGEGPANSDPEAAYEHFHRWGNRWHNGIIRALDAENISIIGEEGSVIDGSNSYDPLGEEEYRGPHGISITNCSNVTLKGYTVRHSGNWANKLIQCKDVQVEGIISLAGHDGFHMRSCDHVVIRNCIFHTGDDCIAGYDNQNVLVEHCELNSACSAFRFGGTGVAIRNCHAFAPAKYMFRGVMTKEDKEAGILSNDAKGVEPRFNMLSFFTYFADGSLDIRKTPGDILVQDCIIEGADRLLHFNYSGNETWQNNRPLTSITFDKIQASDIGMALNAYGDSEEPCTLTIKNSKVSFREGNECDAFIRAANLKALCLEQVTIENERQMPLIKLWENMQPHMEIEELKGSISRECLTRAKEPFICTAI